MSTEESNLSREEFFTPDIEDDCEETEKLAYLEIGETSKKRSDAVKDLRALIKDQGVVKLHRQDDAFLVRFLRAKLLKVDQAHQLMVNYYNFRRANSKLYKDVSPTEKTILDAFKENILSFLPYRDQTGRRVMIYKLKTWNPSVIKVDDILKASLLILELAVLEQRTQILGGVCIFDMEGLSLRHVIQVTPKLANRIIHLMGRGFPIRLKEVHILNQPRIFDIIFGIFLPFLDDKMRARVHLHGGNLAKLHSFVGPKYLPTEYGGVRPPSKFNDWIENLFVIPILTKELGSLGYIVDNLVSKEDVLS